MVNYRPSVALILQDVRGKILVCERADHAGCWQFPQGGVEKGETPGEALAREVREEIGLLPGAYTVLSEHGPYRYTFPPGFKKKNFGGQEQRVFLARYHEGAPMPDVAQVPAEFQAVKWIEPGAFDPGWLPPMKRGIYRQMFADIFRIHLSC